MMVARRDYGTGHLYEKSGSYYGRWRTFDGRQLNRKIGRVRSAGETDGLTRAQAERRFPAAPGAGGASATSRPAAPTCRPSTSVATSLRDTLELRGMRKSYREACEYMQRVHITPRMGERKVTDVPTAEVEALARLLLKKGLAPKSVRNVLGFLHSVFEHGDRPRLARENPVRRAEKPRRARRRRNPDLQFLSMSELDAVIRAIPDEVVVRAPAPTRRGDAGPRRPSRRTCSGRYCAC